MLPGAHVQHRAVRAALDLAAEIAGFGIAWGRRSTPGLEFSPFMLSTSLGFYITVTAVGVDLAGVWLDIAVQGAE